MLDFTEPDLDIYGLLLKLIDLILWIGQRKRKIYFILYLIATAED